MPPRKGAGVWIKGRSPPVRVCVIQTLLFPPGYLGKGQESWQRVGALPGAAGTAPGAGQGFQDGIFGMLWEGNRDSARLWGNTERLELSVLK